MSIKYRSNKYSPLTHKELDGNFATFDTSPPSTTWFGSTYSMIGQDVILDVIDYDPDIFLVYPTSVVEVVEVVDYAFSFMSLSINSSHATQYIDIPILDEPGLQAIADGAEGKDIQEFLLIENILTAPFTDSNAHDLHRVTLTVSQMKSGTLQLNNNDILMITSSNSSIRCIGSAGTPGNDVFTKDEANHLAYYSIPSVSPDGAGLWQSNDPFVDGSCIALYPFNTDVVNSINSQAGFAGTLKFANSFFPEYLFDGLGFECAGTKDANWQEQSLISGLSAITVTFFHTLSTSATPQEINAGTTVVTQAIQFIDGLFDMVLRISYQSYFTGSSYITGISTTFPSDPNASADLQLPPGMTGTTINDYVTRESNTSISATWEDLGGGQIRVEVYYTGVLVASGTGAGTMPADIILNPDGVRTDAAHIIDQMRIFNKKLTPAEMKAISYERLTANTIDLSGFGLTSPLKNWWWVSHPQQLNCTHIESDYSLGSFVFDEQTQKFNLPKILPFPATATRMKITGSSLNLNALTDTETLGFLTLERYKA